MPHQESDMNPINLRQILRSATFAAALFYSGLVPPAAAQTPTCNLACEAFQWAYPIWRNAWSRWAHSAGWELTQTGVPTGSANVTFAMNRVIQRMAAVPPTPTSP